MTARFDVPATEALHDAVVVAAAKAALPKAEFLRDLIERAVTDGCWLDLSENAARALEVLAALHEQAPGQYLVELVNDTLSSRFSMAQRMARRGPKLELEESP
jgi:hypothetical protein